MSNTLVTVLIVLAILMAVAGIALLVLSIYERKRNAEMEALDADGYSRAPRVLESSEPVKAASGRHAGTNRPPIPMEDEAPPYENKKKKTAKHARGQQPAPAVGNTPQPRLRVREDDDLPRNAATPPMQHEPAYRVTSERMQEDEQIMQSTHSEDHTSIRGQAQTMRVMRSNVQRTGTAPAATPTSPVHSYAAMGRERQPSGRLGEPPAFVRQPLSRQPRGASPMGEAPGYRQAEGEETPLPIQPTPVFKPEPLQAETPEPSMARHDAPIEEETYTNRYTPPGFVTPEYQQKMQEEQEAALQDTPFRRIEEPPVRQGPPTQYAPPSPAQTIRPKRVQPVVPATPAAEEEKKPEDVNEPKPQASPIVRSRVHRVGPSGGRNKE